MKASALVPLMSRGHSSMPLVHIHSPCMILVIKGTLPTCASMRFSMSAPISPSIYYRFSMNGFNIFQQTQASLLSLIATSLFKDSKMANSLALSKPSCHARSISLPSRPHPLTNPVQEHLDTLKAKSATASSSSSICRNLCALRDLYESVNEFIQLPLTQQSLSQGKCAEDVTDGSLRLLDACETTRDILATIKESVQELQSSFRRRSSDESSLIDEFHSYLKSRKRTNKIISKSMLNLKKLEKVCSTEILENSSIGMFREVEAESISVLKSILCYASGTNASSKQSSWKLVPKFLKNKRIACDTEEEAAISELETMEGALLSLNTNKSSKDNSMLKQLETVETILRELEENLEPIFRCLLKTRVCLLNAQANH